MTTQQIQYIIALAEEGNFSAAAKKLFVTQPSISQLIKNMETSIGSPLFDRTTTPIKLTPIGQAYYEAAKKIESINRELENRVSEINELKSGSLTIGTTPFRASCMLPKSIAHFNKQFPGIHINIVADSVEKLKRYLIDGEIDLCIENDAFQNQMYITESLSTETFYLAVHKNNPWCTDKMDYALTRDDIINDSEKLYNDFLITANQLQELPIITMDAQSEFNDLSKSIFEAMGVVPDVKMSASTIETKFHWINSNLGAGFIPDTLIKFGNFTEHPLYFRVKGPKRSIGMCQKNIVVAYNRSHYLTEVAKEYVIQLKELIGLGTWLIH